MEDLARLYESAGQHRRGIAQALGATRHLTLLLESLMDDATTLAAKLAELGTKQSSYQAREVALVAAMQAHIDALVAENNGNPNVDLQPLIDQAQAIIDAIPADVPPTIGDATIGATGGAFAGQNPDGSFVDPATDPRPPSHLR